MKIFISHSGKDEAVSSNFCLGLDGPGLERWDQETMAVGKSLADQLREEVLGGRPEWHLLKLLWVAMFSNLGSGVRASFS